MFKLGQKVVGYWGAMWPYSYGKIVEVDAEAWKFVAEWSDGSKYHGRVGDVYRGQVQSCGIGIYFAEGDEPDQWFEKEEAA